MSELQGKVVVITGAARGIGAALAQGFLREGALVAACDRSWDFSDAFAQSLRESKSAMAIACDITEDVDVRHAFDAVMERFGSVDVLVNNAALRQRDLYPADGACRILDATDQEWRRMFDVNLFGTLNMIRAFAKPMVANRSGSIVNISSSGSLTQVVDVGVSEGTHSELPNQPYVGSKAALTNMSFYLAAELRGSNVAVNVVFPGATRTTGSDELAEGRKKAGITFELLSPDHVAPVVLHLAKQRADGTTGMAISAVLWNSRNGS